jgi:T5SS/PEP-CTERM-associated repeat protein
MNGGRGTAQVHGGGSTWTIGGNAVVGNSGSGLESRLAVLDTGSISVAGMITVEATGIVEGNATIAGDISNGGRVSPGYLFGPVEGALHINGDYMHTASGILSIQIGGLVPAIEYDQLMVSGVVSLNGTLEVALRNLFTPAVGDAFHIFDGATLSGTFHTLQLPTLPSALSWNFTQLYTAGTLLVTIAGDFDADGDVDGNDFLIWQRGGSPNPNSSGDLAAWKANFGASSPIGAVPEPSALVLSLVALLGFAIRQRG